ncbi:uracil-DNA glycosylase family protein [Arenibaculum pallidiluteum]|uniref:uracil-DNA glycosylase family protein n=1 Tax=Arenibaculum pallidiluteum TaxID=2812559 RepID=UPI001A965466|nr:uracil-DNA glycosylase family protein [Arenibaculum pallidiluteum]
MTDPAPPPPRDCPLCPRLAAFRAENRCRFPEFHNAPVPSAGADRPVLLVVGLAPALKGGNRTGLPFVGDVPGGSGHFLAGALDRAGLNGVPVRITNAVRCVPPGNRPTPDELRRCRGFLMAEIATGPRVVLALGQLAHESVLRGLGSTPRRHPFSHGARHEIGGLVVFGCYHPSRQNTQTGRLTAAMMDALLAEVRSACAGEARPHGSAPFGAAPFSPGPFSPDCA